LKQNSEELGDPAAHTGNQSALNSRLIHFIKECAIKLVILDGFQYLIDSETEKILAKVSNWLKVLIKETGGRSWSSALRAKLR
jgi:folate-dependent phosphoribosylglycinamide formyltransferase PurN